MSKQVIARWFGKLLIATLVVAAGGARANDSAVIFYPSDNDFETTRENIELAIINRGMLISGTLHVSDMLNRTGPDLGVKKNVYQKAESIEFCSAVLSHKMVQADFRNLVICPFTIAVFIKGDEPKQVYVAFRRHYLAGQSDEEAKAVFELLDGIVREAIE
jgi:hypothetical protein